MLFLRIFLLIFITLNFTQAQTTFKYGVELGYAFPEAIEKPNEQFVGNSRGDIFIKNRSNKSSPLFGIASDLLIGKHLRLSFGAQYQTLGSHYSERRDGNDLYHHSTFRSTENIDQSFTTLCFPVTIGVTAKIWKFSPTFFIGMRPNYLLNGIYSSNYTYDSDIDSLDYFSSYHFDPVEEKGSVHHFGGRLVSQAIKFGVSMFIGECIKLSYYQCAGGAISYSIGGPLSCFGYTCLNNRHVISVAFFMPKKKKPDKECRLISKRDRAPQ